MSETSQMALQIPSTSSAVGSRASPYPLPETKPRRTTTGGCGPSSPESFASYDPDSSSWRTSRDYSVPSTRKLSPTTAAYVAGLIDGEGCITIAKSKKYYSLRIDVGMTLPGLSVLRWLEEAVGGTVRKTRDATDDWAEAWAWGLFGKPVADLLGEIHEHMKVKADQALLGLRFHARMMEQPQMPNGSIKWTDEFRQMAGQIHSEMKALNRKGPVHRVAGEWKTSQRDLFSTQGWATYSEAFPPSGTMRSGRLYRRPPLVPRTFGSARSLLPTPTAGDSKQSGSRNTPGSKANAGVSLTDAVRGDGGRGRMIPTPSSNDWKGSAKPGQRRRQLTDPAMGVIETGGKLNPTWVEWLMGFPIGWTELDVSETP